MATLTTDGHEQHRPVTVLQSIFDVPRSFLESAHLEGEALGNDDENGVSRPPEAPIHYMPGPGGLSCAACGLRFEETAEQRNHFKLDWHRANVQRKLKGLDPVSEGDFEATIADQSSISGSGSDSDNDIRTEVSSSDDNDEGSGQHHPRRHRSAVVEFISGNDTFRVYRNCLKSPKEDPREIDYRSRVLDLPNQVKWAVIMCSGGHFAGAIFERASAVVHKTMHKYIVRKKAGKVQSVRDAASGGSKIKSAGSELRRQNEALLREDIERLLDEWRAQLGACNLIFVFAPGANRKYIFTGRKDSPLAKDDGRIRSIPFSVRRPTYAEVQRVHHQLSSIHLMPKPAPAPAPTQETVTLELTESVLKALDTLSVHGRPNKSRSAATSVLAVKSDVTAEESGSFLAAPDSLFKACEAGDVEQVASLLTDGSVSMETHYEPIGATALHVACQAGHDVVAAMLLEHGADPTLADGRGRVPYLVAKEKAVRDCFRRYMADHPDQWDYSKAQVPSPLTAEMEADQAAKEAAKKAKLKEKKKQLAKQKKEKDNAKKEQEALRLAEEERLLAEAQAKAAAGKMSDRERRALAAERRLHAVKNSLKGQPAPSNGCSNCGTDLSGITAFERLTYRYCAMECCTEIPQLHISSSILPTAVHREFLESGQM